MDEHVGHELPEPPMEHQRGDHGKVERRTRIDQRGDHIDDDVEDHEGEGEVPVGIILEAPVDDGAVSHTPYSTETLRLSSIVQILHNFTTL